MVISIIAGVLAPFAIIYYWQKCSKNSLEAQGIALEKLMTCYGSADISDQDKKSLHDVYRYVQRWWYLPALALLTPILIIPFILSSNKLIDGRNQKSAAYKEAMSSLLLVYGLRNPITATACMVFVLVFLMPCVLIGFIFNRAASLPTLIDLMLKAAQVAEDKEKKLHAH